MPAGWAAADMPGQHGRTVLVTGANSGIGFQVALELARHGAVVLLACRNADRGGAARGAIVGQVPAAAVDLVALDLADLDSVARLAGQVLSRGGGLDLLINNAGVMAVPGGFGIGKDPVEEAGLRRARRQDGYWPGSGPAAEQAQQPDAVRGTGPGVDP